MAKYVIVETSYEYNDEYYERPESEGYKITSKLYSEEQLVEAQTEVDQLNQKLSEDEWYRDHNDEPLRPFKIVKIEE
jgi:hypothetical protein